MLTMPFHNVLRFYPDKTDPVVLTIGAGAAGNQHVCAFTRDGLELSLPLAGPPDERKLERVIRSLCCHERTLERECHQWDSGDLMAYPDRKASEWTLSLHGFHLNAQKTLVQHHLLLRVSGDDRRIECQRQDFLHERNHHRVRRAPIETDVTHTPKGLRGVLEGIHATANDLGTHGAITHGFAALMVLNDTALVAAVGGGRWQASKIVNPHLNSMGCLGF